MSSIKAADLAPLLARFPDDVRLLLFAGPDESASHALAMQAIAALSDAQDPMAVTALPADQLKADPGRLADEAAAVSMFGGRRVIRVDGAGDIAADAVALLLAAPAAGNPVIMLAGDLSKASVLRKSAEGSPRARLVFSYAMDARAVRQWLDARARETGLELGPGVAERMGAAAGNDVGILAQELRKFATFLGAAPGHVQRLTPEHLSQLGAGVGEEDLFALTAAVIGGDGAALARQLELLASGETIRVLRALSRKLLQLLDIRAAMDGGLDAESAVKGLRPPLFWREQQAMARAASRWHQAMIARALERVLAAEAAIKAPGSAGEVLALQDMALIAAGAAHRARAAGTRRNAGLGGSAVRA